MTDMRPVILQKVIEHVRSKTGRPQSTREGDVLEELGVDSMARIAILIALEEEFELDVGRMLEAKAPRTLGELVDMAVLALPARLLRSEETSRVQVHGSMR